MKPISEHTVYRTSHGKLFIANRSVTRQRKGNRTFESTPVSDSKLRTSILRIITFMLGLKHDRQLR